MHHPWPCLQHKGWAEAPAVSWDVRGSPVSDGDGITKGQQGTDPEATRTSDVTMAPSVLPPCLLLRRAVAPASLARRRNRSLQWLEVPILKKTLLGMKL